MKLEISLESSDFWAFNRVVSSGRKPNSVMPFVMQLLFWLAMGYLGMHLFRTGQALEYTMSQWISGPAIIVSLFFLAGLAPTLYTRKVFEPMPDRFILGKKAYDFSAESIQASGAQSVTQHQWSAIVDFVDYKDHFFLFLDSTVALIVPKRVFTSIHDVESFKKLVAERRHDSAGNIG